MNDNACKNIAKMLANYSLDFNKTLQETINYLDKILVLDALTRDTIITDIQNHINKARHNSDDRI